MDISELEPNSYKYRREQTEERPTSERKVEKVVSGTATKRRRNLIKRFADIFFAENIGDVKTYLIEDVILPALKENVADIINSAVGMLILGEARRSPSRRAASSGGKTNYTGYFTGGERKERMPNYTRARVAHNFDDVVLESRGEAEQVLDEMLEILGEYKQVTVADFYDLVGVSTSFTDNKYGWTDLRSARVVRIGRDGYSIDLPRCVSLE